MQEEKDIDEGQLEEAQTEEQVVDQVSEETAVEQEEVIEKESHVSYREDGTIVVNMDMIDSPQEVEPQQGVEEITQTLQEEAQVEDVTEEVVEDLAEEAIEAIEQSESTGQPLPENIQKLVSFMEETGGTLEDYVNLNKDYSEVDNLTALHEYYKVTKPHLEAEEINFLIEDSFDFDEDVDDERDIKRKKLALKEQVASAKAYLDGQKSKYYEEVKAGSRLTPEAQKAIDFFNRYNKESEDSKAKIQKNKSKFDKKTSEVFNQQFKGFEYNVGDKRFNFKISDVDKVKTQQSDINNFLGKFLGKDNSLEKADEYHKSIFTAMNADSIAKHFYEQGKADAIKSTVKNSKNIDMGPRETQREFGTDGIKVKVLGDNSSDFKFKIKKRK